LAFAIDITKPPETKDDLHDYVWIMWGVNIPRAQVCPNHTAPFDAFAEAYFAEEPVTIWKGSRGLAGKSFTLAILCNTEATLLGSQVTILGGSSSQSARVHEVSVEAWEHGSAPHSILNGDPIATMTRFKGGNWIRSLTASQKSARGPHPQRLRLDEIDEMELAILEAAQGQPMSAKRRGKTVHTQTVMSSTHQYPDGTMTEQLKRAAELGWPVREWCVAGNTQITTRHGTIPIHDIQPGTEVLTRRGWRRVQHRTRMGVKPTVLVTTHDGHELVATADHRIAVPGMGWVEAGQLRPGQRVITYAAQDHSRHMLVRGTEAGGIDPVCGLGSARTEVSSLRGATQEATEVLQYVLEDEGASESQHSQCNGIGEGAGEGVFPFSVEHLEDGDACSRATRRIGGRVLAAGSIGNVCRSDFMLTDGTTVVEVYGWHHEKYNRDHDRKKEAWLREQGYDLIILWHHSEHLWWREFVSI
jgi:hypothetical protein